MKKISPIRCICTTEKKYKNKWDNYATNLEGMPMLMPTQLYIGPHNKLYQWWGIECPVCHRCGVNVSQFKTPYAAIKYWNEIMKSIYRFRKIRFEYEINSGRVRR